MVLVTVDVKCCGSSSSPPFKNKIVSEARLKQVLSTHLTDICRYFFNKIKAKLNIFIERFNKVKKDADAYRRVMYKGEANLKSE